MDSGKTIPRPCRAHSQPSGVHSAVEITASKRAHSSAENVFDTLLRDSLVETFNAILGRIAGEALVDAVKRHTSSDMEHLIEKPEFIDQALIAHLGIAAQVLERSILKTLASKTAVGTAPRGTDRFSFASEVKRIREQFLKRKQAGGQPHTLE